MRTAAPLLVATTCTALVAAIAAPAAMAKPIDIDTITASSTYPPQDGVKYAVKQLKDGKQSLAWFEGDSGSGLGTWIEVDLGSTQTVTGFRIWNGYWLTFDMWQRNNRVKNIEVEIEGGEEFSFELKDEMVPEEVRFPSPVQAKKITFRIKGIHNGNTFNDTAISELQVFNDQPSDYVEVASYTASSTYPADADGDYEPDNLGDGVLDSLWCEGDQAGDGVGQWVQLDFGGSTSVSSLEVVNGNALSFSSFMSANSATGATLTFSDGSTESVSVKPSMMKQTITFPSRSTSSVRITFDEVRKGKEFNDLCIAEARALP